MTHLVIVEDDFGRLVYYLTDDPQGSLEWRIAESDDAKAARKRAKKAQVFEVTPIAFALKSAASG